MKKLTLVFLLLPLLLSGHVKPDWGVEFESVFDNREGNADVIDSKTFFFTRLAPEVGLEIPDAGRIAGGVVWFQPIGCEWEGHKVSPTLYYEYRQGPWGFAMGMFPRSQMREELPAFLWSDSLGYVQRNIRGAMVQYDRGRSFFEAYIDWRGMQTSKQREAFNIVGHGQWHPGQGDFYVGAHLMMNHLANRNPNPGNVDGVVDNLMANPYVGADLGGRCGMDSLNIRVGAIMALDRDRKYEASWRTPAGAWVEAMARYKWIGVKNALYAGGKLMQLYPVYGPLLYQGEAFYSRRWYNRTDVYLYILSRREVALTGALDFHFYDGGFKFYQRLTLSIKLGR